MESTYSSVSGAVYSNLHKLAVIVAACFVLVALALSLLLIFQHLKYYTNPAVSSLLLYNVMDRSH